MKSRILTTIMAVATLIMGGCSNEGINFGDKGNTGSNTDMGTLSLASLEVECVVDKREPEMGVSSAAPRTGGMDINTFECKIINEKGEVVTSFLYGERPTAPIELPTGGYTFSIASAEVPQDKALWETPIYGKKVPFKIVRNIETPLTYIVCGLMQIQVSMSYSPDLRERLSAGSQTTISVGEQSLVFALDEKRSGFFYAPLESNTVRMVLNAGYSAAADGKYSSITVTKEITGVKPGQHSDILLYAEHAESGTINVTTDIRDWVVDDPVGTVDVSSTITESIIDENGNSGTPGDTDTPTGPVEPTDPNDPTIVWQGYGFTERYPVELSTTVELDIACPRGIKSFLCTIDSEVLSPDELLKNNLCNVLNLCDATHSYDSRKPDEYINVQESLDQLGIANGEAVVNKQNVHLSITQFMPVLKVTGSGQHNFVLTVTDNNDVTITRTLMLVTK